MGSSLSLLNVISVICSAYCESRVKNYVRSLPGTPPDVESLLISEATMLAVVASNPPSHAKYPKYHALIGYVFLDPKFRS